jgi:hypothetical protein
MESEKTKFLFLVREALNIKTFVKLVFSKPKNDFTKADQGFKSLKYELIQVKSDERVKETGTTKTQTFTKIFEVGDELYESWSSGLENNFFFADLITVQNEVSFKSNSKGSSNIIKRGKKTTEDPTHLKTSLKTHDRKKKYLIDESSLFLQKLNLASSNGKILSDAHKKFRQINKFVEIVSSTIDQSTKELSIVDMGSGKSYLTFALYDFFTKQDIKTNVKGYEIRDDLVLQCNKIAGELGFNGLGLVQSDIANADIGQTDVLIALHACDIATDLAIKKGLDAKAKYMFLSPCCHKQVRKAMTKKDLITKYGIFEERQAEMITDTIRALVLEHYGYSTSIIEFISQDHTSKNTMIIAKLTGLSNKLALQKINSLKEQYGIEFQYLERICGL